MSNAAGVDGLEAVEQAERRLEQRSGDRHAARERRRRRVHVARWTARLGLPVAGAALVVGVIEAAGGDLGGWSAAGAAAFLVAAFLVPAALGAWLARREGWVAAVACALATAGVQGALVFGVAFAALDFGPR